jgi:hypothetical protein
VFSIFVQEVEVRFDRLERIVLEEKAEVRILKEMVTADLSAVSHADVWNHAIVTLSSAYPWRHIAEADASLDFFVCPELENEDIKEKGGGGVTVHSIWKRELNKWNEHHRGLQLYFEQQVIYKSREAPDCCGAPFDVALTSLTVQLVGELKERRAQANFTPSERGQLLSYMQKMKNYQGTWHGRRWYGGFLSDGHFVMLLWCSKVDNDWSWFHSDVLLLAAESTRRVFLGLLEAVNDPVIVSFDGEAVLPKHLLGEGATSHVFCVAWRGKDYVLKRFRPNSADSQKIDRFQRRGFVAGFG